MTGHLARAVWTAARVSLFATIIVGCAQRPVRVDFSHFDEMAECAEARSASIGVSAMALPIAIPPDITPKGSRDTRGLLARRIGVSFAPGSIKPGESLLWNRLTVRTYGGTVQGWTRLQTDGVSIDLATPAEPSSAAKARVTREQAAVAIDPGYLIVSRASPSADAISSNVSVDLLVMPGGMTVDEPVARIPQLWAADGAALPSESLSIELLPVSHAPGYDLIDATVSMAYAIQESSGAVCRGSAETRVTVADREAIRPALWDVGVSALNGPRNRWLAFRDPANGVFRALFESPQAAASFANWIRAAHSSHAGRYTLGLFERNDRQALRPLVPIDTSANETFRELSPQDMQGLRTGPLGEP